MNGPVRIATRRSRLALWQAEHVAARIAALHPGLVVSLVPIVTEGDRILDRSLATVGGKGLFIKELENALQDGTADLAVHSMKDLPGHMPAGFTIAAALERGDARDAFVSSRHATLEELPRGARVGTSSPRRECQLRRWRPDLEVVVMRGNVDTRLGKLDAGECDAIVLAAAGLERLGLAARIRARLCATGDAAGRRPGRGRDRVRLGPRRRPRTRAPARARRDAIHARRRARLLGRPRRELPLADRSPRHARGRDAAACGPRRIAGRCAPFSPTRSRDLRRMPLRLGSQLAAQLVASGAAKLL